jgi:hypothetical protein
MVSASSDPSVSALLRIPGAEVVPETVFAGGDERENCRGLALWQNQPKYGNKIGKIFASFKTCTSTKSN